MTLLDAAERAGARVHFDQRLDAVDFDALRATFVDDTTHAAHRTRLHRAARRRRRGLRAAHGDAATRETSASASNRSATVTRNSRSRPRPMAASASKPTRCTSGRVATTCASRCRTTSARSPSRCSCPLSGDPSFETVRTGADARAFFERDFADARPADPGPGRATSNSNPIGQLSHAVSRPLASRRPRRPARRCRARDGAVPRPGHELRVRGLRRARRPSRTHARSRAGLRRVRSRAPAECARDPGDGAGELPGNARARRRRRFPAAARPRARTRAAPPDALRPALRHGHVPPPALRRRLRARPPAARIAGGATKGRSSLDGIDRAWLDAEVERRLPPLPVEG